MKRLLILIAIIATSISTPRYLGAQEKAQDKPAEKQQDKATGVRTFLRVDVVLNEFDGEKKIGSLPYTLYTEIGGRPGMLRMGLKVPVGDVDNKEQMHYQSVGTNIDCDAKAIDNSVYALNVTVSRSSLYSPAAEKTGLTNSTETQQSGQTPIIRDFTSNFGLAMHDGQTTEASMSADPVSGHVIKIMVTLNVVK